MDKNGSHLLIPILTSVLQEKTGDKVNKRKGETQSHTLKDIENMYSHTTMSF